MEFKICMSMLLLAVVCYVKADGKTCLLSGSCIAENQDCPTYTYSCHLLSFSCPGSKKCCCFIPDRDSIAVSDKTPAPPNDVCWYSVYNPCPRGWRIRCYLDRSDHIGANEGQRVYQCCCRRPYESFRK